MGGGNPSIPPLLRWAGSKRQLVPYINQVWNGGFSRYIEPFCGSAIAFFKIGPSAAALNDLNRDLMDMYMEVRDHTNAVAKHLNSFSPTKRCYYQVRAEYRKYRSPAKRAAALIYLNRLCFNGLYRTNASGQFNVPFSGVKTGVMPNVCHLVAIADALAKVDISCDDFEPFLQATIKPGDFVFLDPPYFVEGRRVFREYSSRVFGANDVERLNSSLRMINQRGATFLMSYAKSVSASWIFREWELRCKRVHRNIAGFSGNRRFSFELLVSNGAIPKGPLVV